MTSDRTALLCSTTHEVRNQPPQLAGYNAFLKDPALTQGIQREEAGWAGGQLKEIGELAGSAEAGRWGFEANEYKPVLHTHDRYGYRIDEIEFHPSWHHLMNASIGFGLHAAPWKDEKPGAHVARAAGLYLMAQVEAGHCCPVSMTYACIPSLRMQPKLDAAWEPLIASRTYDPGLRNPVEKKGILIGMAMTEKQGGSDVRANTTRAVPAGDGYLLTGHKWFCSAPMNDMFLALAQAPGGLSCFLVPRVLPDGRRNRFFIQRLKDKLGNRSNASGEIEMDGAWAQMVGEEGRGVQTIIEMVNHTRLDCIISTAALMRQALVQAIHHARYRQTFGKPLAEHVLMQNVLADLAVESEAATVLFLRLAGACDRSTTDEHEAHFKRIGTALGKYWVCKRGPAFTAEALECLGGNGYVEESIMPRLYRETPLNSIWEGSGNVNCLDVLRAMSREPGTVEAYFAEVQKAQGADSRLDMYVCTLQQELAHQDNIEVRARRVVEMMGKTLQASLLLQYGDQEVAKAYCASRLGGDGGWAFGTLPAGTGLKGIVERAF